jgi:hypothetical protein
LTALADIGCETGTFGADDKRGGRRNVGGEEVLRVRAAVETNNPTTGVFELGQGVAEVGNRGDLEVLDGAGGGVDDGGSDSCGAVGGDDDARGARGVGSAKERPDVLGILKVVENEDVAFGIDHVGEIDIGILRGFEEDALVVYLWLLIVEHLTRNGFDQDFSAAGEFDDFVDAVVLAHTLRHPEAGWCAAKRAERFEDGVAAEQGFALDRERRVTAAWTTGTSWP